MKKKRMLSFVISIMASVMAWANTVATVSQVSTAVTVADDVDYVITSATPFTDNGRVDITNTEYAVVIVASEIGRAHV